MKVLVACEYSGIVRRAFAAQGHDAWSFDLLPSEDRHNRHIQGDVSLLLDMLKEDWDLLIVAHPPCTRLCNSGVRWLHTPPPGKTSEQILAELVEGANLFSRLWNANAKRICVENPVMHKYAKALITNYEDPAQSVQPYEYGHGESKRTCLWLRNLPTLRPTKLVPGRAQRIHMMSPGPDRWKERSRFYPGIAAAMADQWGTLP